MTPNERLDDAIAAFRRLAVPPRPDLTPPAGTAPAGPYRKHSHGRLLMKLSLGGLAAALVLGLALFAATPRVTMAQAVKEVKKHKAVKYTRLLIYHPDKPNLLSDTRDYVYEDLTKRRECFVQCFGVDKTSSKLLVFNGETRSVLYADPCPAEYVRALSASVDKANHDKVAVVTGLARAKLPAYLGKPGAMDGVAKIVFAANAPQGDDDADIARMAELEFARPPLLKRLSLLAESKGSITTRVELDGKPAIKIVGRHDDLAFQKELGAELKGWKGKRPFTVWLDPDTRLPLRVEQPSPFGGGYLHVAKDFEWDPELPAGMTADKLFSTEPPKGYPLTIFVE